MDKYKSTFSDNNEQLKEQNDITIIMLGLTAAFSMLFSFVHFIFGDHNGGFALLATSSWWGWVFYAAKFRQTYMNIHFILLPFLLMVVYFQLSDEGINSPHGGWLLLVPILALIGKNIKAALSWLGIALLAEFFVTYFGSLISLELVPYLSQVPSYYISLDHFLSISGQFLGLFTLFFLIEKTRNKNFSALVRNKETLRQINSELEERVEKRTEALQWQNKLMNYINTLRSSFIDTQDPFVLYPNYMEGLLELTQSTYGLLGDVLYDEDEEPYLKLYALSNLSWSEETKALYETSKGKGFEFRNLHTLFGLPVLNREVIISNNPIEDDRGSGFPGGHPPINSYIGIPIYNGDEIVGVIGLANKEGGYSNELAKDISPAIDALGQIITSRWEKEKLVLAENEISEVHHSLQLQKFALDQHAIVSAADVHGNIIYVNDKFTSVSGYSKEELLGQNHRIVKSGVHTQEFYQNMWETISSGKVWKGEVKNRTKKGEIYWTDATIVPFLNDDGKIYEYISIRTDITQQKELQHQIKRKEQELTQILNNIDAGILMLDQGVIVNINQRATEYLQYDNPEELIGRYSFEFISKEYQDLVKQHIHDDYSNPYEVTFERKDGTKVPVLIQGRKIEINNKILRLVTVVDITELHQLQDDLIQAKENAEAATKAKSNFLANMSHEIRTPMNAIIGLSYMALKTELNEKQKDYIAKINNSSNTLLRIINDILDFSKVEAGKMELEDAPFKLRTMLDDLESIALYHANSKELNFSINLDKNIPEALMGDALRLHQILLNLTNNAIKFTETGSIDVDIQSVELNDRNVSIEFKVRDTGIGLTTDQINSLFKSFSQADASTTRKYGGTGLGLAISQSFVEMMGGKIEVESNFGKGSIFSFTIKFDIADEMDISHATQILAYDEMVQKIQTAKVLLVEDNAINQQVATELLEIADINVTLAENGEEALKKLEEENSDAVLMDVQMPVMDGYTATKEIRKEPKYADLPIIAMTANAMRGDKGKCEEAGMNQHITKPIDPQELYAALAKWVNTDFNMEVDPAMPEIDQQEIVTMKSFLNGFDVENALKRMNNSVALYRSVLKKVTDEYSEETVNFIRKSLQNDTKENVKKIIHDLKSISGTINATELHHLTERLELLLDKNKQEEINEVLQKIENVLRENLGSIGKYLQVKVETKETKFALKELNKQLKEIAVKIENYDSTAKDAVEALLNEIGKHPLKNSLTELRKLVSEYEFDDADKLMKTIEQKL